MMRKVLPGQKLVIPAADYNAFVDAAEAHRRSLLNTQNGRSNAGLPHGIIIVKNASSAGQERFAILTLGPIVITPADNKLEFLSRQVFEAKLAGSDGAEKFVVLQEPLQSGQFGRAMISGITPVKLDVQDEGDAYAGAVGDEPRWLKTGGGPARILYKDAGTGEKWGVIQFPFDRAHDTVRLQMPPDVLTLQPSGGNTAYACSQWLYFDKPLSLAGYSLIFPEPQSIELDDATLGGAFVSYLVLRLDDNSEVALSGMQMLCDGSGYVSVSGPVPDSIPATMPGRKITAARVCLQADGPGTATASVYAGRVDVLLFRSSQGRIIEYPAP